MTTTTTVPPTPALAPSPAPCPDPRTTSDPTRAHLTGPGGTAALTSVPDTSGPDAPAERFRFRYAAVRVGGALAVLHAAPRGAGLVALAGRTEAGIVHHCRLREGIHAWLSGDYRGFGPLNLTGGFLLRALALSSCDTDHRVGTGLNVAVTGDEDPDDLPGVYGQVVFTGFDGRDPVGLTAAQHAVLLDAHATARAHAREHARRRRAELWPTFGAAAATRPAGGGGLGATRSARPVQK